ncbi:MAG: hypothetical protein A2599_01550 [Candidatus Staskawiczbacteria bacterium RIFOXYD1_FULL_39_28]|uniref:Cohesin domain-containing protein n=1 Tax=Candidatus Staskawiczbacteria bacterium RIFOXYC1_FULL_38_18 TaxID=1802229 RepID=A0A1G2JB44_9BACT|nr:MAG: hypothetical protein A2401_00290 [Candidatus Staskawiczbacteria bacterium RIFOXYC1_FULL_38_18]OGZ92003.1 MAG: hypothetical protein A2599_01550 [Candidatus Staskawiczbacteria bacterium RIFOXYD1_FULL_39_28]
MKIKTRIATIILSSALCLLPLLSLASGTASLTLVPQTGSYKSGQTFNVTIYADPAGGSMDTVRVKLSFSPDSLEIENFSMNPIFSYQAGANGFDNAKGTFSWGAGIPGGTKIANNFGTIAFKAKKQGSAQISINQDSLVLSAGQNQFNGQESSATYNLLATVNAPASTGAEKIAKQPATAQPAAGPETALANTDNNALEPQIETKIFAKNLTASLFDSLPFKIATWAWILLTFALVVIIAVKIINKNKKVKI